nr:metallophosphoesterase family protein [bacterium]
MMAHQAVFQPFDWPREGRVIAIGDIHGNLPLLDALLRQMDLTPQDRLVFTGDIIEKGPDSLATLRRVMALCHAGRAVCVCGNCDLAYLAVEPGQGEDALQKMLAWRKGGLVCQMLEEMGVKPGPGCDYAALGYMLARRYEAEFAFLRGLPTVLEGRHVRFVHGGMPVDVCQKTSAYAYMKCNAFADYAPVQDKLVVCGHWPTLISYLRPPDASPIWDTQRRILSIDGGCSLKDAGQLNAVVVPQDGACGMAFYAVDGFPRGRVMDSQAASGNPLYIRWMDNAVRVQQHGAEFCRCLHLASGRYIDILTDTLYADGDCLRCEDTTDYRLPLEVGEEVAVMRQTSRGYWVKKGGVPGWYTGRLELVQSPRQGPMPLVGAAYYPPGMPDDGRRAYR